MATADVALAPGEIKPETTAQKIIRTLSRGPVHVLLVFLGLVWLVPTVGLFLTSLLTPGDFVDNGWWKIFSKPSMATFSNYSDLWNNTDIPHSLVTTTEIAIGGTVLPIIIAALAGYAFAWVDFPGRDWLFILVIALLVVPLQMALIPIFSLYNTFGIFDTVISLILFHTAFALPFAIFLLRNFFIGIPKDILESARIDGASEARIFLRLILPLGLPAIASLAIFQFLWTWNDLLVALTLARDTQPVTVAIFSQLRQFGSNIELIAPAAFLSMIVPLAVFFAFQRYFAEGLLAGSVK
jgi:alpha-glucoside transport system permease protein